MVPVAGTNYALDLFSADVPAVFQGDNLPTLVSGSIVSSTTTFSLLGSNSFGGIAISFSNNALNVGDLVRFDGNGPWYALLDATTVGLRDGRSFAGNVIENANQTSFNTPWPSVSGSHSYEIMRQPIRSGSPLTFGDGRCIDVAQSGYVGTTGYAPFGNNPDAIAVLFDGTGRLRQMMVGATRITPTGVIFLLVGRADRAVASPAPLTAGDDSTGYNWQYADSYWIGIDPLTGVAKVAECAVGSTAAAAIANGASPLVASQSYIRSELLATGR
jgi:hypothetical protein